MRSRTALRPSVLHGGDRPDLILLDLMMPVMDGWAFRRAQRSEPALADVPVIVLSALSTPTAARRSTRSSS